MKLIYQVAGKKTARPMPEALSWRASSLPVRMEQVNANKLAWRSDLPIPPEGLWALTGGTATLGPGTIEDEAPHALIVKRTPGATPLHAVTGITDIATRKMANALGYEVQMHFGPFGWPLQYEDEEVEPSYTIPVMEIVDAANGMPTVRVMVEAFSTRFEFYVKTLDKFGVYHTSETIILQVGYHYEVTLECTGLAATLKVNGMEVSSVPPSWYEDSGLTFVDNFNLLTVPDDAVLLTELYHLRMGPLGHNWGW